MLLCIDPASHNLRLNLLVFSVVKSYYTKQLSLMLLCIDPASHNLRLNLLVFSVVKSYYTKQLSLMLLCIDPASHNLRLNLLVFSVVKSYYTKQLSLMLLCIDPASHNLRLACAPLLCVMRSYFTMSHIGVTTCKTSIQMPCLWNETAFVSSKPFPTVNLANLGICRQ